MTEDRVQPMELLAAEDRDSGREIQLRTGSTQLVIGKDLWRFAQGLCQAGMVPKGIQRDPGAVVGLVQGGAEIGFPPMASLSNLTFINGRLGIMGQGSRALVMSRGALKDGTRPKLSVRGEAPAKLDEWPDATCGVAWCWPKGQNEPVEYTFSVAQARRAGLWKKSGPWSEYPERMLQERAWGFLFRDVFSHLFLGLWTQEELRDIDPVSAARDVSPQPAHSGQGPGQEDPILAGSAGQASSAPQPTAEPGPRDSPAAADDVSQSGEPGKDSGEAASPEPHGGEAQGSGSETANGGEDAEPAPASAPQERLF